MIFHGALNMSIDMLKNLQNSSYKIACHFRLDNNIEDFEISTESKIVFLVS